jgi:hypothetical protein
MKANTFNRIPGVSRALPLLALGALLAFAPVTLLAQTSPAWWAGRGVLTSGSASDFAVANQGQAKNLAVAAVSEIDSDLASVGGAGPTLEALASSLTSGTASATDFAAINTGQLKALAQPFYDRLIALGYTGAPLVSGSSGPIYPWLAPGLPAASDFAAANIGQLKYLFSFDPTLVPH